VPGAARSGRRDLRDVGIIPAVAGDQSDCAPYSDIGSGPSPHAREHDESQSGLVLDAVQRSIHRRHGREHGHQSQRGYETTPSQAGTAISATVPA
jgi:hypothetical protein